MKALSWRRQGRAFCFLAPLLLTMALPLAAARDEESGEVVVRASRLAPEPSSQELSAEEIKSVPGTSGDPVRAAAALPGVSVANDYFANLFVRGSGLNDNLIYLDGFPASYPFHFGGVESVFNPAALAELRFLPSGFGAIYGDAQGGILELQTKRPEAGWHGQAGLSLIQADALLSYGGESGGGLLSYRRGYFDLVLPSDSDVTGVPHYQDYQGQWRQSWLGAVWLLEAFGATDSTHVADRSGGPGATWESAFHTLGFNVEKRFDSGWLLATQASASLAQTKVELGRDVRLDQQPLEWALRENIDYGGLENQWIRLGAQWHDTQTRLRGHFARFPAELGSDLEFQNLPLVDVDAAGKKSVRSAWIEDQWQALDSLKVCAGGRLDYVDLTSELVASPRLSVAYEYDERTRWRAYGGDYFQSVEPLETVPGWASGLLKSQTTRAYGLSLEKRPLAGQRFSVEWYHKDFTRFVPDTVVDVSGNSVDAAGNTRAVFNAASLGFADGVELLYRVDPGHGFFGWLAYGYQYSMRSRGPGLPAEETDFSQPHTLQAVANQSLGGGLEAGLRYKIASGIPYTPVWSRSQDPATGAWTPSFGAPNSERLPLYQRLDLRLQWRKTLGKVQATLSLECLNALDQPNVTSVTYEDDYSGPKQIRQFPRLLYGGFELEF